MNEKQEVLDHIWECVISFERYNYVVKDKGQKDGTNLENVKNNIERKYPSFYDKIYVCESCSWEVYMNLLMSKDFLDDVLKYNIRIDDVYREVVGAYEYMLGVNLKMNSIQNFFYKYFKWGWETAVEWLALDNHKNNKKINLFNAVLNYFKLLFNGYLVNFDNEDFLWSAYYSLIENNEKEMANKIYKKLV